MSTIDNIRKIVHEEENVCKIKGRSKKVELKNVMRSIDFLP